MGGTISIALRRRGADGATPSTLSMRRWTNILPTTLHDPAFLDMDDQAIDSFLQTWRDMANDWMAHGPQGPFVHPMTDVYAPYPAPLAPDGYGLVVIDELHASILSMQSYCSIGSLTWLEGSGGAMANMFDDGEKAALVRDLSKAGRIVRYEASARDPNSPDIAPYLALPGARMEPKPRHQRATRYPNEAVYHLPGTVAPDDVVAAGEALRATSRSDMPVEFFRVHVDMRPFTVHLFDETANGARAMRAHMQSLGFAFTAEDDALWDAWIAEQA